MTQEQKDGRNMTLGELLSKNSHKSKSQGSSGEHDSNHIGQKVVNYSREESLGMAGQDEMR